MEITYKRKHNESFMSISGPVEEIRYENKMIENNDIGTLLDYSKMQLNGETLYNYNISRKENFEDYIESHELSGETFQRIIVNLQIALGEIEKYLLDEKHIMLTKETMFLEKSKDNYKVSLCYYPKDNGTIQEQFRAIIEYLLTAIDGHDKKVAQLIYGIYDVCGKEEYTLGEIIDYIQNNIEIENEIKVEEVEIEPDIEEYEEQIIFEEEKSEQSILDFYDEEEKKDFVGIITDKLQGFIKRKDRKSIRDALTFEDFVIDPEMEIEEKTVLLKDSRPAGKLVYDGHDVEENFIITKDVFRIGSGKNNDAILKSKAVSSTHAKIYREGDNFYIEDLNSLNGTIVGNSTLSYKEKVKLKTMDVIRFADVSYVFM